tara:strand:- start:4321 stop:5193 length:873 start_codon:yes stop_codon:yes gene_type:complete
MESIYIAVTAHNPLNRVDTILKVLRGYESLNLEKEIDIFIDYEHRLDLDDFSLIVASHTDFKRVGFVVAGREYTGYNLCWAHKPTFIRRVRDKAHNFYMYSENDMLFTSKHFAYWHRYKDELKAENLEPGFCRVERIGDKLIPFDNYRKWKLGGVTENVWGDIPFKSQFIPKPFSPDIFGFTTLGNPYAGMMILDQDDADKYIESWSCNPIHSHIKTGKRNWPIADRASMGLAFEDLKPWQEHRRVVPVTRDGNSVVIPNYALIEHSDKKYSSALVKNQSIIDTKTMFVY